MTIRDILESVRRVEIRTRRRVNDMMVGAYLSSFRGRGMDFEDLREYVPGDDVRAIDWNVTRRMGRPFVRRFREERELAMVLALDVSASTAFGSGARSKREYAAEIAATLAFAAARSGDKVGLLLFSEGVERFIPPRKGRRHILRILTAMLGAAPARRGTDIPAALAFLNRVVRRRAIVFLLTDFLHSAGPAAPGGRGAGGLVRGLGITNARHDLVCVHVHDPREAELPPAGLVALEDAETGETLEVYTTLAAVRDAYAAGNAGRLAELDRALRRPGVDTLRFRAGEPFAPALQRFFEFRRRGYA